MNTRVSIQEGSEQGLPHHHLHQTSKKHVATVNSALTHPSVASMSETSIFLKAHFTLGFSFVGNKYYS